MRYSARMLGKKVGLTAQEMNRVLKDQGFITGTPGCYYLTEKGAKYGYEKDWSQGDKNSVVYGRSWTTTSYDESILDELVINEDIKRIARYGE